VTETVQSIDPAVIGRVIEANLNAYRLSFGCLPGAEVHRDDRVVWIDSGVADGTYNVVVWENFDATEIDAGIESTLAHFRARSRPLGWYVGPGTRRADLGERLLAHGMSFDEEEPRMAVELAEMREDVAAPAALTVEEARDERGLREWIDVWLFPAPEEVCRVHFEVRRVRGIGVELPWKYFLGRLDGKPVATSELFAAEGVVGVNYVVTLPAVRRQGIGTAMTLPAMREGRDMGCQVGVLEASPEGIGSYRRIGFEEYCRFQRYEWG